MSPFQGGVSDVLEAAEMELRCVTGWVDTPGWINFTLQAVDLRDLGKEPDSHLRDSSRARLKDQPEVSPESEPSTLPCHDVDAD
jgi:hypothetical protein